MTRSRSRTPTVLLAALIVLAPAVHGATGALPEPAADDFSARLQSLVERLEEARTTMHVPGMAIAVVRDDAVVLARGFGHADLASDTPATPETIFAVGSTTKAFTSALIGMLVDDGRIDWDDPLVDYLPYFRPEPRGASGDAITVRDALSHRSGFARMSLLWVGGTVDRRAVLTTASDAKPWADFRTTFNYNNVMYLAAGEAAAKAGRRSWEKSVRKRILKPLGMDSTTLSVADAKRDPRLATGYLWDEDRETFRPKPMRDLTTIAPAGSINSNVLDMARWVRFQLADGVFEGKRLIREASLAETRTAQIEIAPGIDYGMGWMLREWNGHAVVEHGGNIDGFAAQVTLLPEKNAGFVLLTNVGMTPLQQSSINLVWDTLFGETAESTAEDFDDFLGEYVGNFGHFEDATFTVSVTDGKLAVDVPGQMNFTLKPPGEDGRRVFEFTDQVAVSFDRDDDGDVVALRMHQAGLDFELPRRGYEFPVEIPLDELRPYVGKYRDDSIGVTFDVKIQNNRLAVDPPDPIVFELHPPDDAGRRAFRIRPDRSVRFDRDDEGRVVSMTRFRGDEQAETAIRLPDESDDDRPSLLTLTELDELRDVEARRAAIERIGSIRDTGRLLVEQAGIEGRYQVEIAGLDRYRQDLDFGRFGWVQVAIDGDLAVHDSSMNERETLLGVRRAQARNDHPFVLFGDWRAQFDEVVVLRADTFDERATWVVKLADDGIPPVIAQVDAETGDLLHVSTTTPLPGGVASVPTETTYADYREVSGLRLPARVTVSTPMNGNLVLISEDSEVGVEVPAARFRLAAPETP